MGFKLLIVDDEPLIREGIKQLVNFESLYISEVQDASDGEEALDISKEFKPDIVIADINMPNMDGLSFTKELKNLLPSVHVIILTGYDQYEYTREAIKIGVDDYILKPLSRVEIEKLLTVTVSKLIKRDKNDEINKSISSIKKEILLEDGSYKEKIFNVINENYMNSEFSFEDLISNINLSAGYLSRVFKNSFNKTFPEYLSEIRLEHARLLVIGTDLKIYEITEKCGYNDPNYFSTSFKKNIICHQINTEKMLRCIKNKIF